MGCLSEKSFHGEPGEILVNLIMRGNVCASAGEIVALPFVKQNYKR